MFRSVLSLDFKWKVTFNLLNTEPNQPLSIDGFTFERHQESNKDLPKTLVTYRFTTGSNYPQDILDHSKETIDKFLAVANVNLAMTGWDVREPIEEFELQLENWEELGWCAHTHQTIHKTSH